MDQSLSAADEFAFVLLSLLLLAIGLGVGTWLGAEWMVRRKEKRVNVALKRYYLILDTLRKVLNDEESLPVEVAERVISESLEELAKEAWPIGPWRRQLSRAKKEAGNLRSQLEPIDG